MNIIRLDPLRLRRPGKASRFSVFLDPIQRNQIENIARRENASMGEVVRALLSVGVREYAGRNMHEP